MCSCHTCDTYHGPRNIIWGRYGYHVINNHTLQQSKKNYTFALPVFSELTESKATLCRLQTQWSGGVTVFIRRGTFLLQMAVREIMEAS